MRHRSRRKSKYTIFNAPRALRKKWARLGWITRRQKKYRDLADCNKKLKTFGFTPRSRGQDKYSLKPQRKTYVRRRKARISSFRDIGSRPYVHPRRGMSPIAPYVEPIGDRIRRTTQKPYNFRRREPFFAGGRQTKVTEDFGPVRREQTFSGDYFAREVGGKDFYGFEKKPFRPYKSAGSEIDEDEGASNYLDKLDQELDLGNDDNRQLAENPEVLIVRNPFSKGRNSMRRRRKHRKSRNPALTVKVGRRRVNARGFFKIMRRKKKRGGRHLSLKQIWRLWHKKRKQHAGKPVKPYRRRKCGLNPRRRRRKNRSPLKVRYRGKLYSKRGLKRRMCRTKRKGCGRRAARTFRRRTKFHVGHRVYSCNGKRRRRRHRRSRR